MKLKVKNKYRPFKEIIFLLMMISCITGFAQSGNFITGTVVDETGLRISGVSVHAQVAGEKRFSSTQTDEKGIFIFRHLKGGKKYMLRFQMIGYQNNSLVASCSQGEETNSLLIRLKTSVNLLDEVVVTGQGAAVSKKRLSNNVVSLKGEDLQNIPSQRIDQLLQAKLPNAQIRLTGGQSGATSLIRSRGVSSAFVNSTPIIYVDGVRMDNLNTVAKLGGGSAQGAAISALSDIPMENIDKIEYINGGAATTLYGSDAANGVIQIFTKKSGRDMVDISSEAQMGIEKSTNQFLHFKRTKDLLFENGLYQKYHLGLNGGTKDHFGYSFSGNFTNSSGVQLYRQNSNRKIDFSSGFRAPLGKHIIYESSFIFVNNQYKRNRNGNQGGYTGLWFAEDGASSITGPGFNNKIDDLSDSAFNAMRSYVRNAERLQNDKITVNRFTVSQLFRYNPMKGLDFKLSGGLDYRAMRDYNIQTNKYLSLTTGKTITDQGNISNNERNYLGITLEANGQHKLDYRFLSLITTFGGQFFSNTDHQIAYVGTNIRDGALTITDAATKTSDEYYAEMVNYGIYLQENIGLFGRYFIDLGIRGDGNPAFGKNIGIQYYPKIGFSYLLSAESWFKPLTSVFSSVRLRGNYGVAGNLPKAWANERTISFSGYLSSEAAYFGQPGNDDLKPEKTHTLESAIDLSLFEERITLSAGYYHTVTHDALFYVPSAPSTGQTMSQLYNIGRILNRGWELSLTAVPVKTKDLEVSMNLAVNTLYNRVVNSGGIAAFNINGFSARTIQTVVQQGYPVGYLRGNYGTFTNGVLTSTTPQSYLGTTIPDLFGNMGLNIRYRNVVLFANADYQSGAYASSFDRQFRFYYGAATEGIPDAEIAKNKRSNWLNFTNRFVERTDFIKIRTIGLLVDMKPWFGGKWCKSMSFGLSAVNPLNFSRSSFDPETTLSGAAQGQGGATTGGISYSTYSAPRQFIGSLRINL